MNAISPELALIDPALRRADIARLAAQPPAFAVAPLRKPAVAVTPAPTLVAAPTQPGSRTWPLRAVQLALLLGLLVSGVIVATVVAQNHAVGRPVLVARSAMATSSTSESGAPSPRTSGAADAAALERKLLEQVVQSPSRLPRALIDPSTGLARNNLQAKCRSTSPGGFLCVIRPALHKPGEGLHVRYGPSGFTWYAYRGG